MSGATPTASRALLRSLQPSSRRPICSSCRSLSQRPITQCRSLSNTSSRREQVAIESESESKPRWAETPARMKAPIPMRTIRGRTTAPFRVNDRPDVLDKVYENLMGREGPTMLSDETKWLAVTHKSFDHGRRGFNDRLAFIGKRIVNLQASLEMLTAADAKMAEQTSAEVDEFGREVFDHPATRGVNVLGDGGLRDRVLEYHRISRVAVSYGLDKVVRWQPFNVAELQASGSDLVYAQALYAVVGAVALERGTATANALAREKILQPLAVEFSVQEQQRKEREGQKQLS